MYKLRDSAVSACSGCVQVGPSTYTLRCYTHSPWRCCSSGVGRSMSLVIWDPIGTKLWTVSYRSGSETLIRTHHIPDRLPLAHRRSHKDFAVSSWKPGGGGVRMSSALKSSQNRETQEITHPFPTGLTYSKGRKCARRKHPEDEEENENFPHAGAEGHDGGEGERRGFTLSPK